MSEPRMNPQQSIFEIDHHSSHSIKEPPAPQQFYQTISHETPALPTFESKFKKTQLSPFDKLVTCPAGHMSRYVKKQGDDQRIDEDVQTKIFGKKRAHAQRRGRRKQAGGLDAPRGPGIGTALAKHRAFLFQAPRAMDTRHALFKSADPLGRGV